MANYAELCCIDEDEFEKKIRMSQDVRSRILKDQNKSNEEVKDPIDTAENKGRNDYYEADNLFLRAARLDIKTVLYLEDRKHNCYKLRTDLDSHQQILNCFKDEQREPIDCECDVRTYLNHLAKEKETFSEEVAKHYAPQKKEKNSNKKGSKKT